MPLVSKRVRDAITAALQHTSTGLNVTMASVYQAYGLDVPQIQWDSGYQFFQGWVSIDQITEAGNPIYPVLILYTVSSQDNREIKYKNFSGTVQIGIEVHQQVLRSTLTPSDGLLFENYHDAFEDAFIQTMNGQVQDGIFAASGSHYMRDPAFQRQPAQLGGENWRLSAVIATTWQVHQT